MSDKQKTAIGQLIEEYERKLKVLIQLKSDQYKDNPIEQERIDVRIGDVRSFLTDLERAKAQEEMDNEWVDIKERLPEIGNNVLFPNCSNRVLVAIADENEAKCGYYEYDGWVDEDGEPMKHVTHWRPLPSVSKSTNYKIR